MNIGSSKISLDQANLHSGVQSPLNGSKENIMLLNHNESIQMLTKDGKQIDPKAEQPFY